VYVTKSTAESTKKDQPQAGTPIYGAKIPAGYRDWQLISVGHLVGGSLNLSGGNLKQLRAQWATTIVFAVLRKIGSGLPALYCNLCALQLQ
jgi:hypothetical protein